MAHSIQVTGLVLMGLSIAVAGWVALRTRGYRKVGREQTLAGALNVLSLLAGLFALGAGLLLLPRFLWLGELLVVIVGPLIPVGWAWLGQRLLAAPDAIPSSARRRLGLGLGIAIIVAAAIFVVRPILSQQVWYIETGERWLFFILLLFAAWAMSYFERAYRWSGVRLRKKMAWLRINLAVMFTLWIAATGEVFFWARLHILWLLPLALMQVMSLVALYRFLRVRAEEELPLSFTRRAAYTSVVVIILGVYLLFLGVIGEVIRLVGGDLETYLSVLAAFMAVLLLSLLIVLPSVGRRIRRFVDRHLYKGRIDFAAEWTKITDQISGILDLPTLVKTVAGFLEEAFSEKVYVFLPVPGGSELGLYYPFGRQFERTVPVEGEAADWLWRLGEPIALATWEKQITSVDEQDTLRALAADLGGAIAVPLLARRRFLGFAVLGERRDRPDYDDEDFEFLSAMAGPVAFAVLTGQVSEELLARREMESFNRLSTFVVHDLKNSVSMLSMLLQNARKHMNDPKFQQSALKTVEDAVARMQHLIGKLSGGRDVLRPAGKPVNLNRFIEQIAAAAELQSHPRVVYSLAAGEIPAAIGDAEHIRRTLENLIVNAVEAMGQGGTLTVTTDAREVDGKQWVAVTVADSGCGMTTEFISTRLFKPFESTKKTGLGIGMYQIKKMVEADDGRIMVTSEPGVGTTFEVLWPADQENSPPGWEK